MISKINIQPIMLILCFMQTIWAIGSYEILNLPQDPRSLSLSNTSDAFGSAYFQNNPASISMSMANNRYSFLRLPANIYSFEIQKKFIKNNNAYIGKIAYLNYGKITDSETNEVNSAFEIFLEGIYKKEIKNILSMGVSTGYIFSSIAGFHSNILITNVGFRTRILRNKMGLGISIENIELFNNGYTDIKENLPSIIRYSLYYKTRYIPIVINFNYINKIYAKAFAVGIEYFFTDNLILRIGINDKRNEFLNGDFASDFLAAVSGGVGLKIKQINVNVGFMNLGSAGYILGFSLSK
tara:strand:+ start:3913 stop:4800 length:888 start_codon:yes stop_codon:yes gene_type:complete